MVKPGEGDDWAQYQKLVLSKLESIEETAEKLEARLRSVEIELVMLRVKSSFWGGLAGLGAFVATWLIQFVTRKG